jgi:TonB family protein
MARWMIGALALSATISGPVVAQQKAELPRLMSAPKLDYPAGLSRTKAEGTVIVGALIDSTGRPDPASLRILHSPDERLNEVAKQFVAGSKYRAGRIDGRKAAMPVQVPVRFELRAGLQGW